MAPVEESLFPPSGSSHPEEDSGGHSSPDKKVLLPVALGKSVNMQLFLVLVVLLFEVPADAARPKKCFSNIVGYCRKKCPMGEIYEIPCLNGKLCCVNESENQKYETVEKPRQPSPVQSDQNLDYAILPTVTLVTIQF
ncbi:beta-defensin 128 [Sturnira hondurensis]|uniref:beta-defensin 128 n=1 Tax=Sturnira hondurensis TaxID=192404 RepID=UPI00187A702B|nr:beta-defensin 128 [Sturnira hondurensis]